MNSSRNYPAMQLKAGTLITVALGIALLAMIFPTKGVNPLSKKIEVITYYQDVSGLRASSPVWYSGIEIGQVKHVDFVKGSNPTRIKVVMEIEKRVQKYVKADDLAMIKGMGMLGDMYVDIVASGLSSTAIQDGDVLAGVPAKDMKADLDVMMASAKGLLKNLESITSDIDLGKGSLGQFVKDPQFYQELRVVVSELKSFTKEINQGEGTAKKLLNDPELYDELVASVKDIRAVVNDIKQAEEKMLSPETKKKIDETVETATKVVKRVGEYQEKIDKIRFDLSFGLKKYEQTLSSGHAHLNIWPNEDRYYEIGIEQTSDLYGNETDETTFEAQLGWRILETPLFIHGGLIKDEFFVAGLDLRLFDDDFKIILDAYRVKFNPIQLDAQVGVVFLDLIELNAGVEDIFRQPYFKGGLTIHYRDNDLINILIKSVF